MEGWVLDGTLIYDHDLLSLLVTIHRTITVFSLKAKTENSLRPLYKIPIFEDRRNLHTHPTMHLDIPSILSALPTWPIQSPEPVPAPPPEYISLPAKLPVDIARRMIDYYEPIEFPDLVAQVFAPFREIGRAHV